MVVVPGAAGEIGVLARHAPLVATLKAGSTRVHVRRGGEVREFATGPGFFKVEQDRALALVDDAVDAAHDRPGPRARGSSRRRRPSCSRSRRGSPRPTAGRSSSGSATPRTSSPCSAASRRRRSARPARAESTRRPLAAPVRSGNIDRSGSVSWIAARPRRAFTSSRRIRSSSAVSSTVASSAWSIATTRRSTSAAPRSPTGCGADASAARCCLQTAARSEPALEPPLDPPQPASARTASATGRA